MLRKMPLEGGYHAQGRIFVGSGIVEYAVQQGKLVAFFFNPLYGFGNLVQMRRAGGENDGLFEITKNADKGLVGDIGRRNLEHVHEVVEKMRRFHVKGRRHKGNTSGIAVFFERLEFVFPERIVLLEQLVLT